MKIRFRIKKKIKSYTFLLICLFAFLFQSNYQILNALPMENYQNGTVTEELRLKVPTPYKEIWLKTEKKFGNHGYPLKMGFWEDNYFGIKKKKRL